MNKSIKQKKKKNKSKSTIILVLSLRIREFPGLFVLHGIFYLFFVEYLRRKAAINHDWNVLAEGKRFWSWKGVVSASIG